MDKVERWFGSGTCGKQAALPGLSIPSSSADFGTVSTAKHWGGLARATAAVVAAATVAVDCPLVAGERAVAADGLKGSPWPAVVEGHVPVEPGEHPRLLFRRSDLPTLRARAKTNEGQAIIARLKKLLGEGDGGLGLGLDVFDMAGDTHEAKPHTISHVAGYGFLHLMTGQQEYADKARKCMEASMSGMPDEDSRYSWLTPNGALRAGPSLGWHAVGYDLAYEGWSPSFRKEVAQAIETYNRGPNCSLEELVRGSRHMPGSNHWGMQVGGGALALLAIRGDPGVDSERIDELIRVSRKSMIRNLTEGFGDHGSFAEGDGAGVMSSHIAFLPALQAWCVAAGLDFCSPRPNARWTCLKYVMLTIPKGGRPDFPSRGGYPHNVWSRTGMSGVGTFCQGFGIVNEEEKPALLWLYNRVSRGMDEKADAPFETASSYPHRCILALVNWPFGMKEENPAKVLPKLVVDRFAIVRAMATHGLPALGSVARTQETVAR